MTHMRTRIFSILLTCAMLLSLLPATALAAEGDVAEVDGTGYATLAGAVEAAASGQTVKLLTDTDISTTGLVIPSGKSLTLDLNGKTIKVASTKTGKISVYGTLTIQDSLDTQKNGSGGGKIYTETDYNGNDTGYSVVDSIGEDAMVTLESGYIYAVRTDATEKGQFGLGVDKGGDVTITGGKVEAGWYAVSGNGNNKTQNSVINIQGGKLISTADYAVYLPQSGITNISGGIICGAAGGVSMQRGTLNISGDALITSKGTGDTGDWGDGTGGQGRATLNVAAKYDNCTVSISGGTLTAEPEAVVIASGSPYRADISITGGTFSSDVSNYVAPNYECVGPTDGKYVVQKLENKLVVDSSVGSDGNVAGSLEGRFGTGADITDEGVAGTDSVTGVSGNDVTVDLTTGAGTQGTATTTLNVTQETAASLDNANSLTVKANVAEVSFDSTALSTIADKATDTVAITIQKTDSSGLGSNVKASYKVSVQTAGKDLLPNSSTTNGTVTITIPVPSGSSANTLTAWYVQNGVYVEKLAPVAAADGYFAFAIGHLSEIYITEGEITSNVVASCVGNDGQIHYYDNLAEAVQHAKANTTVTLLNDTKLTTGVDVDKKITLNLNGFTITDDNTWNGSDYLVAVKRGGNLTINDSSANKSGQITTDKETIYCAVKMTIKNEAASGTPATLTVNGGTLKGCYFGISGNGTRRDTSITVNDGTITAASNDSVAIYHPQQGTLIVNGGIIRGNTGIEIRSGSLTVNGGIITGGNDEPTTNPNGNGSTTTNTGIAVAQHTTNNHITVNITGGTISGGAAVYESNPQSNSGDSAVTVNMQDAALNGDVRSSGFGTIAMNNVQVKGNVFKSGHGSMGIVDSTITGNAPQSGVTIINSTVNGTLTNTTPATNEVVLVGGKTYADLQTAINAANSGDTVTLLQDVTLDGNGKGNTEGLLLIGGKNIILDGNGKTIKAKSVTVGEDNAGPSMINIQGGANVTVKNLTIDGAGTDSTVTTDNTKHGLNIYQSTVTVENVTIKNGNGYAIVANGAQAIINGLTTSNNGWGGINVDSKSDAASLTINNANISEANSVKMENGSSGTKADPVVAIQNGTFQYVTKGGEIATPNLTISGGKFATGNGPTGAVNVGNYLAPGLALDGNGNVYTPSGDTGHTGGGSSVSGDYLITVDRTTGGKVTVTPGRADKGDTVTITVKPNDGYMLDELTVTAKNGGSVKLTWKDDNKYTFTMPGSQVSIQATFVKDSGQTVDLPFADVAESDWYYDAVQYVYDNDLMNGTSATTFSPFVTTSRAMILTILARYDGVDTSTGSTWYEAGAVWAIAEGVSDGTNLEANLTREQLVTMLWRYAGSPVVEGDLADYPDSASVSDWAVNAMIWAVENGVITGNGAGALNPQGTATRAEVATILMRFIEK